MPRKVFNLTIADEGRDKGKVFVLTEPSAVEIDKWANRAHHALVKSGGDIPDEVVQMGIIGLLAIGPNRLMHVPWPDLEPLLDELLRCVQIMPDPATPNVVRKLFPNDIEEVSTLRTIRKQVFVLLTGFTKPASA
jgi:hypothetical protein